VWDAATMMTIKFEQRFQQWELNYRYPIFEGEDTRCSALVGPRFAWIWERFKWRSVSFGSDTEGNITSGPSDVGVYTNIVSNRMYGVHAGGQLEQYIGHGFACILEVQGAAFLNGVKERAKYELEQKFAGLPENKNARKEFSFVPEVSAMLGLQWYPTEFVQFMLGYEVSAFFNTLGSREPVDFNYLSLQPRWDHVNRIFDGFRFGMAITF